MSGARRRAERKWERSRSKHAGVLERLESAMRAHPAGGALGVCAPPVAVLRTVTVVRREDDGPDAA